MNCNRLLLAIILCWGASSFAELAIELRNGDNKWGYAGEHVAATQPWNGKPFEAELQLEAPESGNPGKLPRESWFGFYIEDTEHKHRYILGVFNPDWDSTPKQVPFAAVCYENNGNFKVKKSKAIWKTAEKKLQLAVAFTGDKLLLHQTGAVETGDAVLELTPPAGFAPNVIGISLDGYSDAVSLRGFKAHRFTIRGEGPAKSDDFEGNGPSLWKFSAPKRASFAIPAKLELKWLPPESGNNVFDRGRDAEFALSAATGKWIGKMLELKAVCCDRRGRPLFEIDRQMVLEDKPAEWRVTIPAAKLSGNGVYRVLVEARVQGKLEQQLEQQFAVITPTRVTPGQYDRRSLYSGNYFSDWNLAARLGIRQIRQTYWGVDEFEKEKYAERARANGLLINGPFLGVNFAETPEKMGQKSAQIVEIFRTLEKKYPDFIYAQEVYNEPENWPPCSTATDLAPFAALLGRINRELKRSGSKLKLMAAGTTHVNLAFLKKLALLGGPDAADIIAVHGYRSPNRPEFGHEEEIAAIRTLFGDKPVYVNEDAYFALTNRKREGETSITEPFHTMIELDELTHGIYIQRKFLNQLMAGYALVNQFDAIENHALQENEFHRRPGIVTLAALTSVLPHPEFIGRQTSPTDHLWLLDWKTDGKLVSTLWSLNDFHSVTLTSPENLRVLDAFGNDIAAGRSVRVTVGGAPLFVLGGPVTLAERRVTTEFPEIVLPEESPLGEKPLAMEVFGRAMSMTESAVDIVLRNNSEFSYEGILTPRFLNDAPAAWQFVPASCAVKLEPGATGRYTFIPRSSDPAEPFDPCHPVAGKGYNALWWTEGYRISAELRTKNGELRKLHSRRPLSLRGIPYRANLVVDGRAEDWKGIPEFLQLGGERKRNLELSRFWTGGADYTPSFRFAWNEHGLYFLAEVIDDKHDASEKGLGAWRTDSIQLGLNPHHERPDFTDYAVLTLADGNPVILQRATHSRKAGAVPEAVLKVVRRDGDYKAPGRTLYECLIPWKVIGLEPDRTSTLGFCVQFNESDGWWRKGWEGYFVQMGGQIVDPRQFGDLTLVR